MKRKKKKNFSSLQITSNLTWLSCRNEQIGKHAVDIVDIEYICITGLNWQYISVNKLDVLLLLATVYNFYLYL